LEEHFYRPLRDREIRKRVRKLADEFVDVARGADELC
jgi:hypothetical protein